MTTPFDGLRVVDLSNRLSGAFAARLFGDFGADVILVETPEGHPLRHEPPFLDDENGLDRGALHAYVNWNKRSLVTSGEDELSALIASADVLITTADPLTEAPSLIADAVHLCITPHGLNSPLSGQPGNNLTTSARTGWSFINAYRDEPPLQMPQQQAGYVGGVTGFICAAAALRRRDHDDVAELVDVSELEAFALTNNTWAIAAVYDDLGETAGPAGHRPRGRPGPLWDAADGRINFGIGDFHNWTEAMTVLGVSEIGEIEELIPDIGRHAKDLRFINQAIADSLPKLERWPVFHQLARLRCISGVMQNVHEVIDNEQLREREFIVETRLEDRTVRAAGAPAKLTPSPWRVNRPAPCIDEQGEEIRGETRREKRQVNSPTDSLSSDELAAGPLAGIRVLSFGQAWSGTFSTELLALLGADVVQMGSLKRPDVFRRLRSHIPAGVVDHSRTQYPLNTQGHYNSVNLHKREVTLDLNQDKGVELLWQLIPKFDIIADNFRPTVLPRWGVTLEKLHELRPGIIWASVSGYGETGPYWDYPANGATTEPMSGLSSLHGYEGDPGMNTAGLYPDPVAGYFLVAMIMAALAHRDKTGEPQRVDLSMLEAMAAVCGDAIVSYDATGRVPGPGGNHHPRITPHNNYLAADGEWLALAAETEVAWQALAKRINDPRLSAPEFATMETRKANEAELDTLIGQWCSTQDANQAERELGSIGVTAARVKTLYELYSLPDPDLSANGFVSQIEHPETGLTWLPGRPWRFSAAAGTPIRPSPCVGEHSKDVLMAELGLTELEYQTLVDEGVTGTLDDLKS